MQDKHPIDNFFKQGLNNPEIPFDERDWKLLTQKMQARKKRKFALIIWISSGIAASLAIAIFLMLHPKPNPSQNERLLSDLEHPQNGIKNQRQHAQPSKDNSDKYVKIKGQHPQRESSKYQRALENDILHDKNKTVDTIRSMILPRIENLKPIVSQLPLVTIDRIQQQNLSTKITSKTLFQMDKTAPIVNGNHNTGWALSIIAAPDLSGTQMMDGRLSGNIGVMGTYHITNRISLTGGILYAKKQYETEFYNYRPHNAWPKDHNRPNLVDANCRILDIPLMINYALLQSNRAAWMISGGLSSYIMLNESYEFIYPEESEPAYPHRYIIHNENQHLFGIANIGIGYQRRFSPSLRMTVQPFVKVPLKNIGQGNIKLYSTGVTLSADIDLTRRR